MLLEMELGEGSCSENTICFISLLEDLMNIKKKEICAFLSLKSESIVFINVFHFESPFPVLMALLLKPNLVTFCGFLDRAVEILNIYHCLRASQT